MAYVRQFFKKPYQKSKAYDFTGKSADEIFKYYMEKGDNDPAKAYWSLNAVSKNKHEPDVQKNIYNVLLKFHNMANEKSEKPKDKWEQFEHDLKNHDWNYEKGIS